MNGKRVTFTDVLRVREYRILWFADAQSSIGDQIARVALSVLVFERTSSAMLTAVTYSLTFLPALVGGTLLSTVADRVPRRQVMVLCDVIRAVLFAGMAVPRMPLLLICLMLTVAIMTEAPFAAAESALTPSILTDHDMYVVGTGLRSITYQVAQLAGFAGGGVTIAFIGARQGLAVDAATFVLSGILITIGVKARPAAHSPDADGSHPSWTTGIRLVFTNRKLRVLVGMAWLAGLLVVPEGVAAPYASKVSHGPTPVGLLLASMPLGTALGTYLFVRWVPSELRPKMLGPLGVASGAALVCCLGAPPLAPSLVLWGLSGLFFCYQVQVVTEFVRAVPDRHRGQANGIAASGLLAAQGIGILLGGWVASGFGVGWAVGGAGLVAMVLAAILGILWSRVRAATLDGPEPTDDSAAPLADSAEPAQPTAAPDREPAPRSSRHRMAEVATNPQQPRHRA